jgi:hypothetical protein
VAIASVFADFQPRHPQTAFPRSLRRMDKEVLSAFDVHLIVDNDCID